MQFFILLLMVIALGCSKGKNMQSLEDQLPQIATPKVEIVSSSVTIAEPTKYAYPYSGSRDPFTPLVGDGKSGFKGLNGQEMFQTSFSALELKGIVKDKSGKVALLAVPGGECFTLKGSTFYDRRNHVIHGYTGIIRETGVAILADGRIVKELYLYGQ